MKILITGLPGTGKSTISKELNKKGIISMDFADVPGLCYWHNKATKQKVEYAPAQDVGWFDSHERICDTERLKEILKKYENLVITGIAGGNPHEYSVLFDKILLLQCSPETMIHRIKTREAPWGKTETEQKHTLQWREKFNSGCLSDKAILINTEGTLEDVMKEIIGQIDWVK